MKKLLFIIFIITIFSLTNNQQFAQTVTDEPSVLPTKKPSTTPSPTDRDVANMIEKVASRVAQLKLVERKGVIGTVTNVSDTQITISDIAGNTKFIDVDEITKFSSPGAKGSFGISDISKNSTIGVLGLYNKQSRRILGRFVDVLSLPKYIHGAVSSVDAENFDFTVVTEEKQEFTVSVEKITKTSLYTKDARLTKSGFAKIQPSENVIVVGFSDIKNKKKIIASRITVLPEIPKNPRIVVPQKSLNPADTTTPSTGSGKKLTPITR
ncbi:MAG: hypothetical protein Q8P10_00670 [bacterium]|nr:hypothetical protein [bacterium]